MIIDYEDLSTLVSILKMTQSDLLDFTQKQLLALGFDKVKATHNYVYGEGSIPVLIVAHLDTVHEEQPKAIFYDWEANQLTSPQGIGADDRAGVFAILKIIKKGFKPFVLFTNYEEDGCLGVKRFLEEEDRPDLNFIIEFDRRGAEEAVFYGSINEVFISFILSHGFVLANGSSSDIRHICPKWDLAGVNLSIGFYNAHQKDEILNIKDMYNTINRTIEILEQPLEHRYCYQ